jgi:hypothetical protein
MICSAHQIPNGDEIVRARDTYGEEGQLRVLVRNPEGKRTFREAKHNIKMECQMHGLASTGSGQRRCRPS